VQEFTFEDCYCRHDEGGIIIGNSLIERAYDLRGGTVRAASLADKALGREWAPRGATRGLFHLPGMGEEEAFTSLSLEPGTDDRVGLSMRHLCLTVTLTYSACVVHTTLRVYPKVPSVSTAHTVLAVNPQSAIPNPQSEDAPVYEWQACRREAIAMRRSPWPRPDTVESLPLPGWHLRARCVQTWDITDVYNTLAREESALLYGPGYEKLRGNLLFLEDTVAPAGLFVVKQAPNPVGQLAYRGYDFHTAGRHVLEVRGTGLRAEELACGEPLPTYGCTVGVFDPRREDGDEALRAWYNAVDLRVPERDTYALSNTWGNRSVHKRISAEFMKSETDRGAELGLDVCQVDSGWAPAPVFDPATTDGGNSDRYRGRHAEFWTIRRDRFPDDFEDVAEHARERGLAFGAWFAPDDWNDFADWALDRDVLLDLYRRYGMRHFKIDILDVESKLGEARMARFLEGVMEGSGGRVAFQMDLTACRRFGYFWRPEIGEIFLENRYTDWGNYYPHYTLRNIWQLAKYVPTRRLEVEFLDLKRNADKYPDDPLAPHGYPMDYAFGIAMVGSPLAWMELSDLTEEQVAALQPALAAWRRERDRLLAWDVWPIGEEPSGTSWTGFQSAGPSGPAGYLVVFRELNERGSARLKLRGLRDCRLELEVCYGDGFESDGRVDADGMLEVSLPRARSFGLVRYRVRGADAL